MELATTLKAHSVQSKIRSVGINPNYWYAVAWAKDLQPGQVMSITIWSQTIALYRGTHGLVSALENACPHRGVELSKGKVKGDHLTCRYHGWEFDQQGKCVRIPYLPSTQKLPRACTRHYPVQEKFGLIWIFPGEETHELPSKLIDIPEFSQPSWFMIPISVQFKAHFSICNENTMDVFHGILHEDLQGWFDPILENLTETESSVKALYRVSYQGQLAKFLGLAERSNQITTKQITLEYAYPHYRSYLEGFSALYLMRLPISPTESRSFALFFFKIQLPNRVLKILQPLLQKLLQRLVLLKFIQQDKEMVESEQQTYLKQPDRRWIEINPAIIAVQRLIIRQHEQFMRESSECAPPAQIDR